MGVEEVAAIEQIHSLLKEVYLHIFGLYNLLAWLFTVVYCPASHGGGPQSWVVVPAASLHSPSLFYNFSYFLLTSTFRK